MRFGAGAQVRGGRREGGGLIDGFIVERRAESDYHGALAALAQVVSPEPVLGPRAAGALAGPSPTGTPAASPMCVQLAVPPRSGPRRGQALARAAAAASRPRARQLGAVRPAGPASCAALAEGGAPRAVWTALPGPHWPEELARAMAATLASGRGALVVVPDGRSRRRGSTPR